MKPSGVEWIGDIPEGWRVSRIGAEYTLTLGKMIESVPTPGKSLVPYVSAVNLKWGGLDSSVQKEMYFSPSEMRGYVLKMGDVLITEGGSIGTTCAYRNEFGLCGIQNSVIRARGEDDTKNRYLVYWMEFVAHSGYLDTVCNRATIAHYTKEKVAHTPIAIPDNLSDVVEVLESACDEIDSATRLLNNQISILERYKSSLIHEAVTKGLDKDVPTRPSGVEWIGDIPEGWTLQRVKCVTDILAGYAFSSDDFSHEDGVKLLRGINVDVGVTRWDDVFYYPNRISGEIGRYRLKEGDLLLGLDRPWISTGLRMATVSSSDLPALLVQRVARIRPIGGNDIRFVRYCFDSGILFNELSGSMTGISVPHISTSQVGHCVVPLPPVLEQREIADYLDDKCSHVDRILDLKRRQVDVLRRRRQSLIYEYVTGKRRVSQEE